MDKHHLQTSELSATTSSIKTNSVKNKDVANPTNPFFPSYKKTKIHFWKCHNVSIKD